MKLFIAKLFILAFLLGLAVCSYLGYQIVEKRQNRLVEAYSVVLPNIRTGGYNRIIYFEGVSNERF